MAKGQIKSKKETKKPKADKPKGAGSAYKQSQAKPGSQTANTFGKNRRYKRSPAGRTLPVGLATNGKPRTSLSGASLWFGFSGRRQYIRGRRPGLNQFRDLPVPVREW